MKEHKAILGEFENELCAEIARRDLEAAGINSNILKDDGSVFIIFSEHDKAVQLVVPNTQIEKAKKILETRFY